MNFRNTGGACGLEASLPHVRRLRALTSLGALFYYHRGPA